MKKEDHVKDNKLASTIFDTIVKFMEGYDSLMKVDAFYVNSAAYAYARYTQLQQFMADTENGEVQVTKTGYTQVNAYFTAAKDFFRQYTEATKHLGLSPYARSKMENVFDESAKEYKQDPIVAALKGSARKEANS